ncbi:predicted protein [Postia placenta Mad-698-R]|uniref:Fido domain-containing protein n=1 Tax=Postia placenta MAD-698-R-SB12 TaxID=670580 RepID=A0A1X6N3H7_9APHY|nr:hypothetical protein POSPLADRAFT_1140152 [Postia placenta MAD-698-R-SB12]EED85828.1 predicted protein [Postia placenta Mad-698-R]OSX63181.1 hypothetical protein POSPLADRAFT_1140152 [Postia placenta MAD-698-R-SB12]
MALSLYGEVVLSNVCEYLHMGALSCKKLYKIQSSRHGFGKRDIIYYWMRRDSIGQGFSASQRWRSITTADGAFPYCKLQRRQIENIRDLWQAISNIDGATEIQRSLVLHGFDNATGPVKYTGIVGGAVRNCAVALSILRDTRQVLDAVHTLVKADTVMLTAKAICDLHKTLMQTSRVLYVKTLHGSQLSYVTIGATRQRSCVNVMVQSASVKVQFCPFDQVEAELEAFCEKFNDLIGRDDVDPFATAAWVQHTFVSIHPFEDGNGRLSRILSSIPLLRMGLPPLCIQAEIKNIRANRDGDYQELMEFLWAGTKTSLEMVKLIADTQSSSPRIAVLVAVVAGTALGDVWHLSGFSPRRLGLGLLGGVRAGRGLRVGHFIVVLVAVITVLALEHEPIPFQGWSNAVMHLTKPQTK